MCSFSAASEALKTPAFNSNGSPARLQSLFRQPGHASTSLTVNSVHNKWEYGDKAFPQPSYLRNIMQPSHWHVPETARKLSLPRWILMGFGKDSKFSGFAKQGNKHRLTWVFNHLIVEPSVRTRLVCAPERKSCTEREANYVLGTLNKQRCSTWTLLEKLRLPSLSLQSLLLSPTCLKEWN